VGMASSRPGRASAGDGMDRDLRLRVNIENLLGRTARFTS
jgi:hypothetical protein